MLGGKEKVGIEGLMCKEGFKLKVQQVNQMSPERIVASGSLPGIQDDKETPL